MGTFTGHVLPLLMNPVLGSFADLDGVGITGVCLGISIASALTGLGVLTRPVLHAATVA